MNTNCLEDRFVHHILLCIDERKLTVDEIHKKYLQLYPPRFDFIKKILPPVPLIKVRSAVKVLLEEEYITKELTRFTDQPLDRDTEIYFISQHGREAVSKIKKKR